MRRAGVRYTADLGEVDRLSETDSGTSRGSMLEERRSCQENGTCGLDGRNASAGLDWLLKLGAQCLLAPLLQRPPYALLALRGSACC